MSAQCQKCGARTGGGNQLCRRHLGRLADILRRIPALVDDLEITATRQDRLAEHSVARNSGETPLPWNERASAELIELNALTNGWALIIEQHTTPDVEDPLTPAAVPAHDTAAVTSWLRRQLPRAAALEQAARMLAELDAATRRARTITDRPDTRARFEVGPCPEDVGNTPCPGMVFAAIPDDEAKPAMMRCTNTTACGAAWNTTQWLRAGERILRRQQQIAAMRRAMGED